MSAYAVDALGEIAFAELPEPGTEIEAGQVSNVPVKLFQNTAPILRIQFSISNSG